MSNEAITYLVGACCGVFALAAFAALDPRARLDVLQPLVGAGRRRRSSRSTSWPRWSASACSAAPRVVWFWDRWAA